MARRFSRSCSRPMNPRARAARSCCRPRRGRTSPTTCGRSNRRHLPTDARMARVHHCRDYRELSREAAARVIAAATAKGDSLLCAPAGNSPAGLYRELAGEAARKPDLFRSLRVVKLDEWLGVPASDAATCEHFLRSRLLDPLVVTAERYIGFDPETADPQRECADVQGELERQGPIDLCILGLGKNGHV